MDKDIAIKVGGKLWTRGKRERVYFSDKSQIANIFNYAPADSADGMIPAGFEGMIKNGKTRSYFDVKNNLFFADSGDLANAARANGVTVRRI